MSGRRETLRAGRSTAGKLLTNDELYDRINRTADRLDKSVDSINSMIAEINEGRGMLGKLIKDEQIYNEARAAIARFTPQLSVSTVWSLRPNAEKAPSEN